jgi:hypothetical protein
MSAGRYTITLALPLATMAITTVPQFTAYAGTIATIHPGDTISITATLNTTDPNENGEGESIVVEANTQTIFVDPNFALPATYTYHAPPAFINPGSPIPNIDINYYINKGDGDETATFSTSLNPTQSAKNPADVARWNSAADFFTYGGFAVAAGGTACAIATLGFCEPAAIPLQLAGVGSAALGYYLSTLARDPADPNYKVIATPNVAALPSNLGLAAGVISDDATGIALISALITSYNRYQGAIAAGDQSWASQQLAAITKYSGQLNTLLATLSSDTRDFANQLLQQIPAGINVTQAQISQIEQYFATNGLTSEMKALLMTFGLSPAEIQNLAQVFYVLDPTTVDANFPASALTLANQLANLLSGGSGPTSVPEPPPFAILLSAVFGTWLLRRRRQPS